MVGRAGLEPAVFLPSLIYSQLPSPIWIPTRVVGWEGVEPSASGLSGQRSDRLSYHPKLVFPAGLEPATSRLSVERSAN